MSNDLSSESLRGGLNNKPAKQQDGYIDADLDEYAAALRGHTFMTDEIVRNFSDIQRPLSPLPPQGSGGDSK